MNLKKMLCGFLICLTLGIASPLRADSKIKIVTTTSTFASIVREITNDHAQIDSIASPNRDIHFIAPTPKDVLKVKQADVFVHAGLDLEVWRGPLLNAVGRIDLMEPAGDHQINVSKNIPLLEIPASLSRAQGDIHASGNPHYWMDPENARIIALTIAEGLSRLYPDLAPAFKKNAAAFEKKMELKLADWEKRLAPYRGEAVVTYHNSWPYFMNRFGFKLAGFMEPNPGIPPTPKHLLALEETIKKNHVRVIIKEVFQESRAPKKVAAETGARIVTLAQESGEIPGDYFALTEHNVLLLEDALK